MVVSVNGLPQFCGCRLTVVRGRFPPFGAAVITHPNASAPARLVSFIEVTPLDLLCSRVEGCPSHGKPDPSPAGDEGCRDTAIRDPRARCFPGAGPSPVGEIPGMAWGAGRRRGLL